MKRSGLLFLIATLVLLCLGTMLVRSPQVRAQNDNNQGNQSNDDESKIKQGLAIAPVPLNLEGKNRALVGLGSYIVNAQVDCNGCHGLNPAVEFTPTGNPYLLSPPFSGTKTVNPSHYLAGGRDFGPFPGGPGSIPHLYTRNLTPDKTGRPEGGRTFEEFVQIMRHGTDFDHIHPSCTGVGTPANCLPFPFNGDLLQVMPWPAYANMTDRDLLAIYTYLSAIPATPDHRDLTPHCTSRTFANDIAEGEGQVQSCQIAAPVVTAQGTYRCASYAEVVTVLTGSYGNNFGEKFEPKGEMMKPGSLFVLQP